jgi:hypothetical protein
MSAMSGDELRTANLIIAGTGKSGTTSLFHYLCQHPDICGARIKETHFFSPLREGKSIGPLSDYAAYFDGCGNERYRLEATPAYCTGGAPLIAAIKQSLYRPRIVIVLRDPTERLWDSFRYMKSKLIVEGSLEFKDYLDEAHRLRAEGMDTAEENRLFSWARGFYAEWVIEWMDAFGDDLRVVFFEHMVKGPAGVVGEICKWLELDTRPVATFDYAHHNPTRGTKSRLLQGAAYGVERVAKPVLRVYPGLRARFKGAYVALNARASEDRLDPDLRHRLNETYRSSNARVASELRARGYDELPGWLAEAESGRAVSSARRGE